MKLADDTPERGPLNFRFGAFKDDETRAQIEKALAKLASHGLATTNQEKDPDVLIAPMTEVMNASVIITPPWEKGNTVRGNVWFMLDTDFVPADIAQRYRRLDGTIFGPKVRFIPLKTQRGRRLLGRLSVLMIQYDWYLSPERQVTI